MTVLASPFFLSTEQVLWNAGVDATICCTFCCAAASPEVSSSSENSAYSSALSDSPSRPLVKSRSISSTYMYTDDGYEGEEEGIDDGEIEGKSEGAIDCDGTVEGTFDKVGAADIEGDAVMLTSTPIISTSLNANRHGLPLAVEVFTILTYRPHEESGIVIVNESLSGHGSQVLDVSLKANGGPTYGVELTFVPLSSRTSIASL